MAGEVVVDPGTGFRFTVSLGPAAGFVRGAEDAVEAVEEVVEAGGTWSCLRGRPRSIVLGSFLRSLCWRTSLASQCSRKEEFDGHQDRPRLIEDADGELLRNSAPSCQLVHLF